MEESMTDEERISKRLERTEKLCRLVATRIAEGMMYRMEQTGHVDPSDENCADLLLHILYMLSGQCPSHQRLLFIRTWLEY
jgi:hypothetical protein